MNYLQFFAIAILVDALFISYTCIFLQIELFSRFIIAVFKMGFWIYFHLHTEFYYSFL